MKISSVEANAILDREKRRLIERLSGWRLSTFFFLLATNAILLVVFGFLFPVTREATREIQPD